MKKVIIYLLFTLLLWVSIKNQVCAKYKSENQNDSISITAILSPGLQELTDSAAFIRIMVSEHPFNSLHMARLPSVKYIKERLLGCGNINIRFSATRHFYYMNIALAVPGKIGNIIYTYYNVYVLEKGTSVKMYVDENNTYFKGEGAVKLNLQFDLFNKKGVADDAQTIGLMREGKYQAAFERWDSLDKEMCLKKMNIVKSHKFLLGNDIYNILSASCLSQHFSAIFSNMRGILMAQWKSGRVDSLFEYYLRKYFRTDADSLFADIPKKYLLYTPLYTEYLYEKSYMNSQILLNLRKSSYVEMNLELLLSNEKQLFESQDIKRQLYLLTFLVFKDIRPEIKTIMDADSRTIFGSSIYGKLYKNINLQNRPGKPFYDFQLMDSSGRIYHKGDFDGKLVIMDFWFTGCENCIVMQPAMERIINAYKDNPLVVFVTISIDSDFNVWKKSIKQGLYTHTGELNLYTEGKGNMHSLIKRYMISAYPRIMIMLNGKLYKSSVPAPRAGVSDSSVNLANSIQNGLKDLLMTKDK
ncbi:MAG: TlpA disulfide reductase family protein [Arachidicoccus sp.]|nr:TlpA disulfide reductase family protein [Arachidicoccus sp.]